MLSCHLCPGLPCSLRPPCAPTKILYAVLSSPIQPNALPIPSLLICSPKSYWVRSTIIKLLIIQFASASCCFIHLGPNIFPQHPAFKHPQSIFPHRCKRPSFTPIHNSRQNCNFHFYSFRYRQGRWKIPKCMVEAFHTFFQVFTAGFLFCGVTTKIGTRLPLFEASGPHTISNTHSW